MVVGEGGEVLRWQFGEGKRWPFGEGGRVRWQFG